MTRIILAATLLSASTAAFAWPQTVLADPYGADAIAAGQGGRIAPRLAAAVEAGDRSPEVLLNLAAARLAGGQQADAAALYREVLAQPNADMATLRGTAWSHDIARTGIARTQAVMAAR